MKRLSISIFCLLLSFQVFAMNAPMAQVGTKRSTPEEIEEIAPAAKEGRNEGSENYLLSQFPTEIQAHIRKYLDASTGLGVEKLHNVARNIRNLRLVSKADRDIVDDSEFIEKLIQFLAERYTKGNRTQVALSLHTKSAADWLNAALLKEARQNPGLGVRLLDKQVTNEIIEQLKQGHADAARFLLNAAKVPGQNRYLVRFMGYATDADNETLLHAAAEAGDLQLFNIILAQSIPVINYQNDAEETALMISISNDHTAIALALLQAGASPLVMVGNTIFDTALLRAAFKNNTQVVRALLNHPQIDQMINFANEKYPFPPIYYAVDHNNYPMFQALLAIPNIRLDGDLLYKVLTKNTQMVKDLISKEINVNQDAADSKAAFGLFAKFDNNVPVVNDNDARDRLALLLSSGLNVNMRNSFDATLLMEAVYQAKVKTIEELLHAHANVSLRDVEEWSALDYAQRLQNPNKDRIIKLLTESAAKQGAQQ